MMLRLTSSARLGWGLNIQVNLQMTGDRVSGFGGRDKGPLVRGRMDL